MLSLLVSLVSSAVIIPGFPDIKLNDNQIVALKAQGTGTQNYACRTVDNFTFKSVDAKLTTVDGREIGSIYYLKRDIPRATWEVTSGPITGTVTGKQASERVGTFSPDMASGLFSATSGTGKLGEMEYVIALNCKGGANPRGKCDIGTIVQVPFTCDYWFVKSK